MKSKSHNSDRQIFGALFLTSKIKQMDDGRKNHTYIKEVEKQHLLFFFEHSGPPPHPLCARVSNFSVVPKILKYVSKQGDKSTPSDQQKAEIKIPDNKIFCPWESTNNTFLSFKFNGSLYIFSRSTHSLTRSLVPGLRARFLTIFDEPNLKIP